MTAPKAPQGPETAPLPFRVPYAPQRHAAPGLEPSTSVVCELYRCTLPASSCALRTVRLHFGRRAEVPQFPQCAACATGKRRREWLTAHGWDPGNLRNEVRPDHVEQNKAKHRYYRTRVPSEFVPAEYGG